MSMKIFHPANGRKIKLVEGQFGLCTGCVALRPDGCCGCGSELDVPCGKSNIFVYDDDAERAVIDAAKAWNDYNGCSPDEYCRLASALHLAVDALEAKQ
jgi:hypothetical protein